MTKTQAPRHCNILRLSGELCIKSPRVRRRFLDRLVHNIRSALDHADMTYEVDRHWSRIDVHTDHPRASTVLARIYGVQGVVPARRFEWDTIEEILDVGQQLYQQRVVDKTFGVRARRVGNRSHIPFDSNELARKLGARLFDASAGVDLDDPEVVVGVEIRQEAVFFFDDEIDGPAGLPMGTEGKAVCLMSGGFDSAVAAHLMQRRGVDLDFLFFNLGGPAHERGVRDVTKRLCRRWSNGYSPMLHVVDLRSMVAEMKQHVAGGYWQLLLKRLMMRAADRICQQASYPAMITGESTGQVSSQTLTNLAAIEGPISTPILRPLVGMNKNEILARARTIDTYEISADVPEFCALDGGRPVTDSSPQKLDAAEAKLNLELLDSLVDQRQEHAVFGMTEGAALVDVEVDCIPDGAVIVDLRDDPADNPWGDAAAQTVHLPFETAIDNAGLLPREPTYLLVCDVGLKSAFVAERMRQADFNAHSFRGGVPALGRHVAGQRVS